MGKNFIAYDPELTRECFNSDVIVGIYYKKLLNYDELLEKDNEGFFTVRPETVEVATCVKRRGQDRARNWLIKRGFIATVLKVPLGKIGPQVHYRIIDKKL